MKYMAEVNKYPGTHKRIAVTDTAQSLTLSDFKDANNGTDPAISVTIICEDNNIRVRYDGSAPTNTGDKEGFPLFKNQSLKLSNWDAIQKFQFINDVAGANGVIQICPEFDVKQS